MALRSPAQADDWKDSHFTGEWALEGEQDGDAIRTTLLVRKLGDRLGVTRRTTRVSSQETRELFGKATREGRELSVELEASSTGLVGALGGGWGHAEVKAVYSVDADGELDGKLDAKRSVFGWDKARESGTRAAGSQGAHRLLWGPYLQDLRRTSVAVLWRTTAKTESLVEFGPTLDLGKVAGDPRAQERSHEVLLEDLLPGTRYFYRIVADGKPQTALESFTTAPRKAEPFRFLALGDSGSGTKDQLSVARELLRASGGASFVLHMGDVVYPTGKLEGYAEKFFAPYADLIRAKCVFPTCGNHDVEDAKAYDSVFRTPANNPARTVRYYSFDWGDARFVSVDTSGEDWKEGPQAEWLRAELASNTRRWLVVLSHVPLYTTKDEPDVVAVERGLGPILEAHKVDLVLTGHKHRYERTLPIKRHSKVASYAGAVHVTTGGGGADLSDVETSPLIAKAEKAFHFLSVGVTSDRLELRATDGDGKTIDSFALSKD